VYEKSFDHGAPSVSTVPMAAELVAAVLAPALAAAITRYGRDGTTAPTEVIGRTMDGSQEAKLEIPVTSEIRYR